MKVIKKLGNRQDFKIEKIHDALKKTAVDVDVKFNASDWREIKPRIKSRLDKISDGKDEIYFWEIDDAVSDTLLRSRFNEIAKGYILAKAQINKDDLNDLGITPAAMYVLRNRYLRTDENGNPVETVKEMFARVATEVASVEKTKTLKEQYTNIFFEMMKNKDFLPNSPALVSAGSKSKGTYSACFAYSIEDSLDDILYTLQKTAKTFQLGGGVGISIAKLREKGAPIHTTNGESSGSVEFLKLFDVMCTTIKTGGFRRGALMCLTEYNHPDIEEFISCKKDVEELNNMNISILVDDKFFKAVENKEKIDLISPQTNKVIKTIDANYMLEKIATNIWETGEPGLLFYDRMNEDNPTPHLGDIRVTNPCSESNLLPNEACNLGSINLLNHLNGQDGTNINWDKLAITTKNAVRFLDNLIDASPYPTKEVEDAVKLTRKIGVGVMGFADVLIKKNIKYSSDHAIEIAEKIMSFVNDVASEASCALAEEKGHYPAWKVKYQKKRRNAIVTIQAPTGTLSLIANVSPGIEPNFHRSYKRQIADGAIVSIAHPLKDNPAFEEAHDIPPDHHLKMLAKVQEHIENSVSKTINAPEQITIKEIKNLIIQAWKMRCKGMTIFRNNCHRASLIQGCEECKIERGEE